MRGILQGLGLTLSHVTRPKVTRLYPYEKRKLPPRSRGLIQLIQEDGQATPFNLKCEACLLCEKACPTMIRISSGSSISAMQSRASIQSRTNRRTGPRSRAVR